MRNEQVVFANDQTHRLYKISKTQEGALEEALALTIKEDETSMTTVAKEESL